ncbi:MAG: 5'-methylthioadenosine/S-adenosylhomocysteine nucleosidase, partial [Asticcacaulis sp.]|nr:5'-methylthioadenosine/S-adenosylhomocysteine nucleosidase [Asticcacaulis sp.]
IVPHIDHAQSGSEGSVTYVTGELEGKPVVVMESGVSMVNAAMNTQRLLDRYKVTRIVFSGIAGGIDPSLHIGDIVVADQWAQPMETLAARETPDGYRAPPWLWGMSQKPNFGMFFPRQIRIGAEDHDAFPADPALLAVARQVAAGVVLKDRAGGDGQLAHRPQVVVGGEGVSAPSFIDNAEYRDYLFTAFHARVTDMETAAVAQVAYANQVPFIAFRSVSDLAGGDTDINQMTTFMKLASENSAAVVIAFIKALPED